MYFTKEFSYQYATEINENIEILNKITQEDLDHFMLVSALKEYYYETLGFLSGGACHIVLDDGNLEDAHIQHCLDVCITTHDKVGESICNILFEISEEIRELMFNELSWFFDAYVEEITSKQLRDNLTAYYDSTKPKPPQEEVTKKVITFEALLKESQLQPHSWVQGQMTWGITFKGEGKQIPTQLFRFTVEEGDSLSGYIKLDEIESIKIV